MLALASPVFATEIEEPEESVEPIVITGGVHPAVYRALVQPVMSSSTVVGTDVTINYLTSQFVAGLVEITDPNGETVSVRSSEVATYHTIHVVLNPGVYTWRAVTEYKFQTEYGQSHELVVR